LVKHCLALHSRSRIAVSSLKAPHVTTLLVQTCRKDDVSRKISIILTKKSYSTNTVHYPPITMMLHRSHPSLLTGFSPPRKYYTTKVTIYSGPQYLQTILFIHIFCNYYAVDGWMKHRYCKDKKQCKEMKHRWTGWKMTQTNKFHLPQCITISLYYYYTSQS
jgi:hypothetical protein